MAMNEERRHPQKGLGARALTGVGLLLAALCLAWLGGAPAPRPVVADAPLAAPESASSVSAYPEYSDRWRVGFGCAREYGDVDDYAVSQLCAGWYHDWGTQRNPSRPDGMEYMQLIRVSADHFDLSAPSNYNWADLDAKIRANPGSVWMIGNEPDGKAPGACDNRLPADYARIYKIFYDHIKGIDSTAKISNGPIIQATPVRMSWLTQVWDQYQSLYGVNMPVDVWNMHNQIVREAPSQGADIPPGCDPALGMNYGIQDNDNMTIFADHVVRMRQWMKDRGQQAKPLIISEYGVLQPEYEGFTRDRINDYMNASFTYLYYATSSTLGMPADGNRLVQRWNWFSLNTPVGTLGQFGGWNGNMFDPDTHQITETGINFSRWVCSLTHPTPTPATTPRSPVTKREAEHGSAHGSMERNEIQSASDCRYVYVPDGATITEDTDVTFNVYVPNGATYVVWGRVWGTDYMNRSFNVSVDGGPYAAWYFGTGGWTWSQVSNAGAPMTYSLAGSRWHSIKFVPRGEGKSRIDKIVVTNDQSYNPATDSGLIIVCNPTPTATPTVTRTPTRTATPTRTRTPMPTGPARISGQVAYQGRGASGGATWQGPLIVSAHLPGDSIPAYEFNVESDQTGYFLVPNGILTGTYDVGVRDPHSLRNLRQSVSLTDHTTDKNMGTLIEGDTNSDNRINILDFSILASCYGTSEGGAGFDVRADLNEDGVINILDFSLLASNYGQTGDLVVTE